MDHILPIVYYWLKPLLPIFTLLLIVFTLWLLLWKLILEPNPLIRDFFDLDLKQHKLKEISIAQELINDKEGITHIKKNSNTRYKKL